MGKPIALVGDSTLPPHAGKVSGPGSLKVKIGGKPVALQGCLHVGCAFPSNPPHPPTPFIPSQVKVMIENKPVLVHGDTAGCGAAILATTTNVLIK
ncbi:MAG: hypothetical protein FD123_2556 [Bacteroidetes bacterium]|nr:MAG: hypothetical protein FD123_2556 [Bacteroidota bacterium]